MISLEFEIPAERFAVERNAIIGGAVGDVEGENRLEPIVARVDETDFTNEDFPARTHAETNGLAVAKEAARKSGVDVDWFVKWVLIRRRLIHKNPLRALVDRGLTQYWRRKFMNQSQGPKRSSIK